MNNDKAKTKNLIITLVLALGIVGGVAMLAFGLVRLLTTLTGFLSDLTGMIGGGEGGNLDIKAMIPDLAVGGGLLLGGFILALVCFKLLKSQRKKMRDQRRLAQEAANAPMGVEAILAAGGTPMGGVPMAGGGPVAGTPVRVPNDEPAYAPAEAEDGWRCPTCGERIEEAYNVCPHCATRIGWGRTPRKCATCGETLRDGWAYCPTCGTTIEAAMPRPESQQGPRRCMYCGATLEAGQDTCPVCNHKFVVKQ